MRILNQCLSITLHRIVPYLKINRPTGLVTNTKTHYSQDSFFRKSPYSDNRSFGASQNA